MSCVLYPSMFASMYTDETKMRERYVTSKSGREVFLWSDSEKHMKVTQIFILNVHNKRQHTSIIIGFPSFMAFFKSPAKPSER